MPILQTILKHLSWYTFLALFALTALLLAFSSGAGVIFSLVLAALISLMQLGWLALAELRTVREYQIAQLDASTQLLEVSMQVLALKQVQEDRRASVVYMKPEDPHVFPV